MLALVALVSGCSETPENRLLSAATQNDIAEVVQLIDSGHVDVNYGSRNGQTALLSASSLQHVELVRLLLQRGADPNVSESTGMTPLLSAAYDGNAAITQMLILAGANVDTPEDRYGYTPLAAAALKGHLAVVNLLIEANADLAKATHNGRTPLQLALEQKHERVAQALSAPRHSNP